MIYKRIDTNYDNILEKLDLILENKLTGLSWKAWKANLLSFEEFAISITEEGFSLFLEGELLVQSDTLISFKKDILASKSPVKKLTLNFTITVEELIDLKDNDIETSELSDKIEDLMYEYLSKKRKEKGFDFGLIKAELEDFSISK